MKNNLLSIEEYRNNAEFYFYKGLRCANKRNLNDAYKNLVKASVLKPDNSEYKFNLACFMSEMKRPKEANRLFNDILLNYDPTMYDCYFGLGCNNLELGDSQKAAEYFDKYLFFDGEGEFNEEVEEMIFYLKLYNDISHDNKFIKISKSNFKKAIKSIEENKIRKATKELYKSINSNPFNVEARNLLTLVLMEQQKFNRADYINSTVRNIFVGDVWAKCLYLYILSASGKHNRVSKLLDAIQNEDIKDRSELLCVSSTFLVFNRISDLVKLLETYVIEYSDSVIYSILLLGYIQTKNYEKAAQVRMILLSLDNTNLDLSNWVEYIKANEISPVEEYVKLFFINNEEIDYMYNPKIYSSLINMKVNKKPKLSRDYSPIIESALKHREIMYTHYYEKEIIEILNECLNKLSEPLSCIDEMKAAYSAALEYIYCNSSCIEMEKEELINKYNISTLIFNNALKKLNSVYIKND